MVHSKLSYVTVWSMWPGTGNRTREEKQQLKLLWLHWHAVQHSRTSTTNTRKFTYLKSYNFTLRLIHLIWASERASVRVCHWMCVRAVCVCVCGTRLAILRGQTPLGNLSKRFSAFHISLRSLRALPVMSSGIFPHYWKWRKPCIITSNA